MNIVQTKKHIDKLYKRVYADIKQEFASVLNPIYQEIYNEVIELGYEGDSQELNILWLEKFFKEYNPVTKYVFLNEIDRKKSRLFESLVASTSERTHSYATAEKQLLKQIDQYAIDLEDYIAMAVFSDLNVERVKWVAEKDYKTCSECKELDGETFAIDEAPAKQHYHCRCILVPVRV
jgi:hypothetical protein